MFKWLRKSMLRKNILTSSGIVLVVVLALSIASYLYSSQVLSEAIDKELAAVLDGTIKEVEGKQSVVENELRMLTNQVNIRIYNEVPEKNVRTIFRDYKTHNEGIIESIFIVDVDGNVFIDSENKRLEEWDVGGDPAFAKALSGEAAWSKVLQSPISDQKLLVAFVPIIDGEEIKGTIATAVYYSQFDSIFAEVEIGEKGYAYVVDNDGTVVSHRDPAQIDTNLADVPVPELVAEVPEMISGGSQDITYTYKGVTKKNLYAAVGTLSVNVNAAEEEYLAPLDQLRNLQIVIGLAFFVLGTVIAVINAIMTVKKIKRIEHSMALVSEGDLTAYVQFKPNSVDDEVGQIGRGLNKMLDSIKEMITHIKLSSESLAAASQQLSASADQNRMASEETANSMQEIAEGAERQVVVMMDTTERFEVVNGNMTQSSDVAKSMSDKSIEVKEAAENGERVIQASKVIMGDIKGLSEETVEVISSLNIKSDKIGEINEMISQIAEQTNLLALNAAIEAARAGEQGKGFAVVADEIRKLAAQSQESAQGIQSIIVEMQEMVKAANDLIQTENVKVDEGISSVQNSEDAFVQIKGNIDDVVSHINEVVESVYETMQSTEQVNVAIEEVVSIVHETSASSEAIAASSEEQMAVSEEISSSSTQLAQMAEDLLQTVITFKTE